MRQLNDLEIEAVSGGLEGAWSMDICMPQSSQEMSNDVSIMAMFSSLLVGSATFALTSSLPGIKLGTAALASCALTFLTGIYVRSLWIQTLNETQDLCGKLS